jgi:DMSO reductase anchor subunit
MFIQKRTLVLIILAIVTSAVASFMLGSLVSTVLGMKETPASSSTQAQMLFVLAACAFGAGHILTRLHYKHRTPQRQSA